jgi:S1-C subfamily serine protease
MKKLLLTLLFIFVFCATALSKELSLNEITESSCRISVRGSSGSGITVFFDKNYFFILTNAHVIGNNQTAEVEYFKHGVKTDKIQARVVWKRHEERTDIDFALLTVPATAFNSSNMPRVIPLAPKELELKGNEYLASVGYPYAKWASGFEGRLIGKNSTRVFFIPPPEPGRSGSGVCINVQMSDNSISTYVAGLVTWNIGVSGNDANGNPLGQGGAILISTFYSVLKSNQKVAVEQVPLNYKYVSNEEKHAVDPTREYKYALCEDNKYYLQYKRPDGSVYIKVPPGLKVIDWDVGYT